MTSLMERLVAAFARTLIERQADNLTEETAEKIGEQAYRLAGAAYRGTQGKKRKKDAKSERTKSAAATRIDNKRRWASEDVRRRRHDAREEQAAR